MRALTQISRDKVPAAKLTKPLTALHFLLDQIHTQFDTQDLGVPQSLFPVTPFPLLPFKLYTPAKYSYLYKNPRSPTPETLQHSSLHWFTFAPHLCLSLKSSQISAQIK